MYNLKSIMCATFCCALLFSSSITFGQERFEGKVIFKTDDDGKEQVMTYMIKGTKFRIEQSGDEGMGQGAMIYDSDTRMRTIIMNEQKMYMEMPMDDSQEFSNVDSDEPEYFANTGETMDILGNTCDKFEFKDKDKKGIAWMTKNLGPFLLMSNPKEMKDSKSRWQDELVNAGYFPLLVKEEDSSGELKTVFEVTELLPMELNEDLFLPPPGFSKYTMPNIPNMMDMKKHK